LLGGGRDRGMLLATSFAGTSVHGQRL
jgi:hypothetical protein